MAIGFPPEYESSKSFPGKEQNLDAAVRAALEERGWKYKAISGQPVTGSKGMSLRSWGEKFKIERDGATVYFTSRNKIPIPIWDIGKNKSNSKKFFATLEKHLQ